MKSKFRRLSCACLATVMCTCLSVSSVLTFADSRSIEEDAVLDTVNFTDVTGKMDLSSVTLKNLSTSVLENAGFAVKNEKKTVIVTLSDDCIMDSVPEGMGVAEYLDTYTGAKALKSINRSQENFLNSLSSLGVSYTVVNNYTIVTNAVAIEVDTSYLSKIKSIASVDYAVVSQTYAYPEESVLTSDSGSGATLSNVYETGIYNSSKYVNEGYDGSGMTVAILDTGLDYTHSAFQSMPQTLGMTKSDVAEKLSASAFRAVSLSANKGNNITVDDLYVNAKVPFAYDYADKDTDVYPSYSQHGVHVAGIVAGKDASYTDKNGETAKDESGNTLTFRGVAPEAQLVICKVFTDDFESKDLGGARSEDLIAALEDCVYLGVDVINMSLGTSAGFSNTKYIEGDDENQAIARVYKSIKEAGISLICAASNDYSSGFGSAFGTNLASNPDSGTVGSPSTFEGALSVASINGQLAPFLMANGTDPIYYNEASDENAVKYEFAKQMLGGATSKTFKYVVIPGLGQAGDYTTAILNELNKKEEGEKVIAVIKRGSNTFQDKVQIAMEKGADAVIIYNNVAGTIGMTLGDLDNPVPSVSVTADAGTALCYNANGTKRVTGTIEVNSSYLAGPFMNDYSSWGPTPDLKLKPEITSHGGEITSTVSGGYAEMSGTSMASPNMAGFVALLRGKLKQENPDWDAQQLNQRINQILMSTATTVYDQNGLPYSPRKQGAGLGTLDNVFSTKAYLYTLEAEGGAEDNRPKIELGSDTDKTGVYNFSFYVANFGDSPLSFTAQSIFMTETLASDGLAVAEKAHLLTDIAPVWKVGGVENSTGKITVAGGASVKIEVTISLSDAEKAYIEKNFTNGMFVEGFIKLLSDSDGQCGLTLPFLGFYGDWSSLPMLDYDAYQIAESQKDTSLKEEEKLNANVWATQAYASYYNEKYSVPIGGYGYLQDPTAQQIYAEEEHSAISMFNNFYGDSDDRNYQTTTSIKSLYAGLLRNAELVTYDLYNVDTGELILQNRAFQINKAYAGGGAAVPAQIKTELYPEQLGLQNNGKYRLDFYFYFDADDEKKGPSDNTFTMQFYVDYEAPVLVDARIRYYDYKENNTDKQNVYLDLDVYDNHYPQAVVLCYADRDGDGYKLNLATQYATPVYNANKNDVTTVSIDITNFYEKYQNKLYIQIDDYALNHSVYKIDFASSRDSSLPDSFEVVGDTTITLGVNETYKVSLSYEGTANLSNFTWTATPAKVALVNNGEIFGVSPGRAIVTVRGANGAFKTITVNVVESGTTLSRPSISFGAIVDSSNALVKASGSVKVNAGQDFSLEVITDPWYYPVSSLDLVWASDNEKVATVDQEGNVSTWDEKGTATITATIAGTAYAATVRLNVQEPFTISGSTLTAYHGRGGDVVIPTDKNVMTIAEEAFKDNDNITSIIIPKTVTQISEKAFINCSALEEVYFIQKEPLEIPDASLALILKEAFKDCVNLKLVDLSNVKTITLDSRVFYNCTSLEEVKHLDNVGTMNDSVFYGCTSLVSADISGLHDTGSYVFAGCTSLEDVTTAYYTSIGEYIFAGCTSLKEITIYSPIVSDGAFAECYALQTVNFGGADANEALTEFIIGSNAFYDCLNLTTVNFNGYGVSSIGDMAFAKCRSLTSIEIPDGAVLGIKVFDGTNVDYDGDDIYSGAYYIGTKLVLAPENITADFEVRAGTTEIAAYAFANSKFADGVTLTLPDTVTVIGEGAFNRSGLTNIVLSSNLKQIADYAFAVTPLKQVTIPSGVEVIGSFAFANCLSLTNVNFAGSRTLPLDLGEGAFYRCVALEEISLPDLVATGEKPSGQKVILAAYVFAGCVSLESVDLANVMQIGAECFAGCTALGTVNLKNVKVIGDGAFAMCDNLTSVTGLENVTEIGASAFYGAALGQINIASAVKIGSFAFYGNNETTVAIPAGLNSIGDGAFANSSKLTSFTVENGNTKFFVEDGVLYRMIEQGSYDLVAYPTAKVAATTDGVKTYEVKEGTVSIGSYAFNGARGTITEIKFPYTLKIIGTAAFYDSGISSYVFECIEAPILLSDYYDQLDFYGSTSSLHYFLYYTNFEEELLFYTDGIKSSSLKISYPTNGSGYDGYVYSNYFGTKVLLGERMEDTTRSLKAMIESFASAAEVAEWSKLTVNEQNLQMVTNFSEEVKKAHAVYNTITGEGQLEFLGEENIQKLFDIEAALKPVKSHFNIPVKVTSLTVSADSTHRTTYVEGEKFDMTGLKLTVTNDDYSVEEADMSKVTIVSGYDGELSTLNRYVTLEYNGTRVQVAITVTKNNGDDPDPEPPAPVEDTGSGCNSGCASTTFGGGSTGGFTALGILAVAAVALTAIRRKKSN